MSWLARWISTRRNAWSVVAVAMLLAALGVLMLQSLRHEDDLLAFLPQDDDDVRLFYDINEQFGGLDLALIGVENKNPFSADFLSRLKRVTRELSDDPGLNHVLSLTNVIDFTPNLDEGGIVSAPLVQAQPKTAEEEAKLREKVMSRRHVVGQLISRDGQAVLIYAFLSYGRDPKSIAGRIRSIVNRSFDSSRTYWAGGPFISTYIYETVQKDLRRLPPWAVAAIVLIMLLVFRDPLGTLLALTTTGMGIVISIGLMAALDVPFNIVLGAMPVILFAIGSVYGIHLLSRYYALAERLEPTIALQRTLTGLGPVVIAAGLTTVVSLLSFVLMDMQPIRTFGVFTAIGILCTLLLSLTFIPAVIVLTGLTRKQRDSQRLRMVMVRLSVFSASHRRLVIAGLIALIAVAAGWISQVDTGVDQTTFFSKNSPPDLAGEFMLKHFGGSQFVQVFVQADLSDPQALRQIRYVADRISAIEHVSDVQHIGQALALSNEAMSGQKRIPDTGEQVRLLYTFTDADPAMAQLISKDRSQGLIHIKVDSNRANVLQQVLERIEQLLDEAPIGSYQTIESDQAAFKAASSVRREQIAWRIRHLAREFGLKQPRPRALQSALADNDIHPERAALIQSLKRFLQSEECAVDLSVAAGHPAGLIERVAARLADLPANTSDQRLGVVLSGLLEKKEDDSLVQDLVWSVSTPLRDFTRDGLAAKRLQRLARQMGWDLHAESHPQLQSTLQAAFWDLQTDQVGIPLRTSSWGEVHDLLFKRAAHSSFSVGFVRMQANGLPVMHRGLSRSIHRNQVKAVAFALSLIILILSLMFRSFFTGLLVTAPTVVTLAIIYGGMGVLHVHLDMGTSLLASLILGIGVDYAVHLVAAWRVIGGGLPDAAARAADRTGPAIWTSAIMIFAGFFVLTLGEARPLQNVGGLTAAAMLVAALATFVVIPALARKKDYLSVQRAEEYDSAPEPAEAESVPSTRVGLDQQSSR